MKSLIIGGGSVGLGLASCLLADGQTVDIVARPAACTVLATEGLRRTGLFGEFRAQPDSFGLFPAIDAVPESTYDYLLVCTQSFDSAQVARQLSATPLVTPLTRLVLFQNGHGNFETFAQHFPPEQIFVARVITGFYRRALNHVEVTVHAAPIHVGSFLAGRSPAVADLCAAIAAGGIPTEVSEQIDRDLWAKILYNSMLNPLGAIFDATYGELGASPHSRALMEEIASEGFAVMQAAGSSTHWPSVTPFLDAFYGSMLPPTRDHESSMLQSIRSGRRTEIDALNGAILTLGKRHGLAIPTNETVVRLIRFLEEKHFNGQKSGQVPRSDLR